MREPRLAPAACASWPRRSRSSPSPAARSARTTQAPAVPLDAGLRQRDRRPARAPGQRRHRHLLARLRRRRAVAAGRARARRQRRRPHRLGAAAGGAGDAAGRRRRAAARDRRRRRRQPLADARVPAARPVARPAHRQHLLRAGFTANWELDFFGRNRRLSESAAAQVDASAGRGARGADGRGRRGGAQLPRAARPAAALRGGAGIARQPARHAAPDDAPGSTPAAARGSTSRARRASTTAPRRPCRRCRRRSTAPPIAWRR